MEVEVEVVAVVEERARCLQDWLQTRIAGSHCRPLSRWFDFWRIMKYWGLDYDWVRLRQDADRVLSKLMDTCWNSNNDCRTTAVGIKVICGVDSEIGLSGRVKRNCCEHVSLWKWIAIFSVLRRCWVVNGNVLFRKEGLIDWGGQYISNEDEPWIGMHFVSCRVKIVAMVHSVQNCTLKIALFIKSKSDFEIVISSSCHQHVLTVKVRVIH